MIEKFQEAASYIEERIGHVVPDYSIILGSGLSGFVNEIENALIIPYHEIPNFPVVTVEGHHGNLIFGEVSGKKVLVMQGRFHYYEGHDIQTTVFPVRVFNLLGINNLIASNASGGVNPKFRVGDVMILTDHINMMPEHPLRGKNDERFGPRFVNMSEPYSQKMIAKAKELAKELNIEVQDGVYLGLQGPTFETLAEYRMVKALGGDCVGMSTVPEVIVARHMEMECFGLSVITDMGDEENIEEVNHAEVLKAAQKAEPHVRLLIRELIKNY